MRSSNIQHVIAMLRRELHLQQRDFASRIGCHTKTIQKIEATRLALSPALALRASEAFDVDLQLLLENDLEKVRKEGFRDRSGQPWSNRTRAALAKRLTRWGDLEPLARAAQMNITHTLLTQYLEISQLIRRVPQSEDALFHWTALFNVAVGAFVHSHNEPPLKAEALSPKQGLESIFDDIQAVRADLRVIKRFGKRQANGKIKLSSRDQLLESFAGLFGWDDRGFTAGEIIDEMGVNKVRQMTVNDFADLVIQRCQQKRITVREWIEPFDAIQEWRDSLRRRIRRAKR